MFYYEERLFLLIEIQELGENFLLLRIEGTDMKGGGANLMMKE